MLRYEKKLWKDGFNMVAGIDEAGRGPLAGPVVAAAVAFHKDFVIPDVDDSKKIAPRKRELLFEKIINNCISFGVGIINEVKIDEINILNASILAMHKALKNLTINPDFVIVDGNKFWHPNIPFRTIIKGDSKSFTIAAASIIAKVTRDRLMIDYDKMFPEYKFFKHKGYGTKEHINILKTIGPSIIHRKSFKIKSLINTNIE